MQCRSLWHSYLSPLVSIMMPRAQVAAERVNEILDMEVMIKDPEEPKEFFTREKR